MAADRTPTLRPLALGDVLDELFALYRRGFKTFIGIAALVHVPLALLTLPLLPAYTTIMQRIADNPSDASALLTTFSETALVLLGLLVVVIVVASVIGAILELAATCYATSALYLGHEPTVGGSYREALARFWPLLRLSLLVGTLFMGLIVLGMVPVVVPPLLCISLPAVIAALTFFGVLWSLATPALVLEGRSSALSAMERSGALVQAAWWRTGLTLFVLGTLLAILNSIASGLATAGTAVLQAVTAPGAVVQPTWLAVLNSLLNSAVNVLFAPFFWIGITLLYYDRRIRAEAYDLTVMARELTPHQPSDEP